MSKEFWEKDWNEKRERYLRKMEKKITTFVEDYPQTAELVQQLVFRVNDLERRLSKSQEEVKLLTGDVSRNHESAMNSISTLYIQVGMLERLLMGKGAKTSRNSERSVDKLDTVIRALDEVRYALIALGEELL